jgi:hypothetical protein
MKRIESKYRDQFIQYLITQVPVTGLWASEGQVLVRENGSLKIFPLESLGSKFTSEDDAETYTIDAGKQMIDKLLKIK